MSTALIEAYYLPPISYFSALQGTKGIVLEGQENYQKQTFRNRCWINTPTGPQRLTAPVEGVHGKIIMGEVRVDYSQYWQNTHWRALVSAYAKSPFFEHYSDALHDVLFKKQVFLLDLNLELLTLCLSWLKWDEKLSVSRQFEKNPGPGIKDLRNRIGDAKKDGGGNGFERIPYPQVFGKAFVPDLSIVDLVFCQGPGAGHFIGPERPIEQFGR